MNRRLIMIAVFAELGLLAGCLLPAEPALYKERPIRFSHAAHHKSKCADCHRKFSSSPEAGMPSPQYCLLCHKTQEERDKWLTPFAPDGKLRWSSFTALSDEIVFSHQAHYDREIGCAQCHRGIETSAAVSPELRVTMDQCQACHARQKPAAGCRDCHPAIDQKFKPAGHGPDWKRRHGMFADGGDEGPYERRCGLCHEATACDACHRAEQPASHNIQWRLVGHGIQARFDRNRCATCHRVDGCERCHQDTAPRSHRAGWGGRQNRHCASCHFPVADSSCYTCHRPRGMHPASPLPVNITHRTASSPACITCHVRLGDFRHFESGDECRTCHR